MPFYIQVVFFRTILFMFELKKIISSLLMPLPAMLILGFVGLMLIMFTAKRKTGCMIVLLSLTTLFLISFQPFATRVLMPLEDSILHSFLVKERLIMSWYLVVGMWLTIKFPPRLNSAEPH